MKTQNSRLPHKGSLLFFLYKKPLQNIIPIEIKDATALIINPGCNATGIYLIL
jgi:hypothetical protein